MPCSARPYSAAAASSCSPSRAWSRTSPRWHSSRPRSSHEPQPRDRAPVPVSRSTAPAPARSVRCRCRRPSTALCLWRDRSPGLLPVAPLPLQGLSRRGGEASVCHARGPQGQPGTSGAISEARSSASGRGGGGDAVACGHTAASGMAPGAGMTTPGECPTVACPRLVQEPKVVPVPPCAACPADCDGAVAWWCGRCAQWESCPDQCRARQQRGPAGNAL